MGRVHQASAHVRIFLGLSRTIEAGRAHLQTWIVSWSEHVSAADRLTAARIAMQRLLTAQAVTLNAHALTDHSKQCTVTIPGPAWTLDVVPPGPEPHRLWVVAWTSTQVAAHAHQAGGFALNTLFEGDGVNLTIADQFLSDARSVTVAKRRKEASPWLR